MPGVEARSYFFMLGAPIIEAASTLLMDGTADHYSSCSNENRNKEEAQKRQGTQERDDSPGADALVKRRQTFDHS